MENTNRIFSSDRFSALMKAELAVNKSNYIKLLIAVIGVFAAIALLMSISAIIDINNLKHVSQLTGRSFEEAMKYKQSTHSNAYFGLSVMILSIGLTIIGSLTFSNLSSKKQRISAFMIPASQIEKFTLRLIIYVIGGVISLLIGFFIGIGIVQIAYGGGGVVINNITYYIDDFSGYGITALILLALLGNSLYALGSSLWPKLSWIKTWVIISVIEWIGAICMFMLASLHLPWNSFFMHLDAHIVGLLWTCIATLAIMNIACWVLAWYRYRNTQIIQRFMTK